MPHWSNWSGRRRAKPRSLHFVRSEADAAAVVAQAQQSGQIVRVAGAGHSHADLIANSDQILDCSGLSGVVSVDTRRQQARVWAGTPIYALGNALYQEGLALHNQGDIDRQSIAGAVATGTHGTGLELANLSASVVGARIVTAAGEMVEVDAKQQPELWQAARLNLGALGVVTQLNLQLRSAYRLQERTWTLDQSALLSQLDQLTHATRHFEFFYYPQTGKAEAKSLAETDATASYPVGEAGARCAWSHEVLPNYRPHPHTEMEYSVPAASGPACFSAICELLANTFTDVAWPVEYRTLAADDVWLSSAYQRDTVTISVHQAIAEDERAYYQACEAIFRSFDGRPHWGKVNYLSAHDFAAIYPNWQQWWKVRNEIDPTGVFLNEYLRGLSARS